MMNPCIRSKQRVVENTSGSPETIYIILKILGNEGSM